MKRLRLTTRFAKSVAPPAAGQAFYYDNDVKQLALRVLPSGAKSWIVNITHNGKLYRRTLKPLRESTAEQARDEALKAIGQIKDGQDPLALKRERRRAGEEAKRTAAAVERARQDAAAHTLRRLCELYLADLQRRKRGAWRDAASLFKVHVYDGPEAAKPAREVTPREITAILRRVIDAGHGRTAAKLRSYLRAAYQRAAAAQNDPTASADLLELGIETNPVAITASLADFNVARKRKLSERELAITLRILSRDTSLPARAAWIGALLGGQRPTQLLRAQLVDFDETAKTLTLYDPKGRRKEPRPHVVPVVGEALPILKAFAKEAKERRSPWLFSTHGKVKLRAETVTAAVTAISDGLAAEAKKTGRSFEPFVLSDLRKAVETQLAALGVSKEVRGVLLSHGLGGVQNRSYNFHDYAGEMIEALKLWHARIAKLVKGPRKGVPSRVAV